MDLERDVLNQMEFKPVISKNLKKMPEKLFRTPKMNLFS